MKLISGEELARALGTTIEELESTVEPLYQMGFPKPRQADAGQAWAVVELLDWVTAKQEIALQLVLALSDFLDARE